MIRFLFTAATACLCCAVAFGTAAAEELTADDYIEFWRPVAGVWKGTFEIEGEVHPITFRLRIAPNKKCIVINDTIEGVPGTQQLQVYDPVARKEIAWGVDNEGNRQIQTIVIDGMEKGKKAAPGIGGSWELNVFRGDGTTTTTTSEWEFARFDGQLSEMVWSNVTTDGVAKPDVKMTLERQRSRRRTQE